MHYIKESTGKLVILTPTEESQIRIQIRRQEVIDTLYCYEYSAEEVDNIPLEDLDLMAGDYESALYDNTGDMEYALIENWQRDGLIPKKDYD